MSNDPILHIFQSLDEAVTSAKSTFVGFRQGAAAITFSQDTDRVVFIWEGAAVSIELDQLAQLAARGDSTEMERAMREVITTKRPIRHLVEYQWLWHHFYTVRRGRAWRRTTTAIEHGSVTGR
jgi:hypothetical protein